MANSRDPFSDLMEIKENTYKENQICTPGPDLKGNIVGIFKA